MDNNELLNLGKPLRSNAIAAIYHAKSGHSGGETL